LFQQLEGLCTNIIEIDNSNNLDNGEQEERPVETNGGSSNPIVPSQAVVVVIEQVKDLCKNAIDNILLETQGHLSHALQSIRMHENEKMNHIRRHYDEKLNTCRVSHLLERDRLCLKTRVQTEHIGEKLEVYYKKQIHESSLEFENCQVMRRLQDQTLQESQQCLTRTENALHNTRDEYCSFKESSEEKVVEIENMLNFKRKQEVWAHFKIVHLKKKARVAERALLVKKRECKEKEEEVNELQRKLKTSIDIREGLERAFEKRASIRGRLDILNETNKLSKSRPQTSEYKRLRTCANASTQAILRRGEEMKDTEVDTSPFYHDEVNTLLRMKKDSDRLCQIANEKMENATKQNEAYRRLMSGKSIALILASKHRELSENPRSLDAEILYNLSMPNGVLIDKSSQKKECVEKKRRKSTAKRKTGGQLSIPKVEIVSLEGIHGNQIKVP